MTTRPEGRPGRGVCGDERGMQEAADATAFSAAVLHARGMNLLVMINLIMACVLAVRVALKVAYIVLNVLAIAFSWFHAAR